MTQKPKGKPLSRLTDAERHKRFVAMAKEVGSPAIGLGAWRVRRGGPRGLALGGRHGLVLGLPRGEPRSEQLFAAGGVVRRTLTTGFLRLFARAAGALQAARILGWAQSG